jgi:SAM-dependent methyltransferase
MLRAVIVAAALCLPGLLQAQDKKKSPEQVQAPEKKKSPEQVWNELFAKREGKVVPFNKFLGQAVKDLQPGKALDIGMGQGRNSLFLAAFGWEVTGFDISEVGVKQAQTEAASRGLKIDARVADADKFDYGKARWDLVLGLYMYEYLDRNAAKVVASLKPGGLLVVEGIHRDIGKNNLQGERYGYRNNELPKIFNALRIRYYEDTTAQADWDRSGGKLVPVVRLLAVKETAAEAAHK